MKRKFRPPFLKSDASHPNSGAAAEVSHQPVKEPFLEGSKTTTQTETTGAAAEVSHQPVKEPFLEGSKTTTQTETTGAAAEVSHQPVKEPFLEGSKTTTQTETTGCGNHAIPRITDSDPARVRVKFTPKVPYFQRMSSHSFPAQKAKELATNLPLTGSCQMDQDEQDNSTPREHSIFGSLVPISQPGCSRDDGPRSNPMFPIGREEQNVLLHTSSSSSNSSLEGNAGDTSWSESADSLDSDPAEAHAVFGTGRWNNTAEEADISFDALPHREDVYLPDDLNEPYDIYRQFVTDDLLEIIAHETNRYAEQKLMKDGIPPHARIRSWQPTNVGELRVFFGVCMLMGLVKLPQIDLYWTCKNSDIYVVPLIKDSMRRDRFQLLLSNIHFVDTSEGSEDRLFRIRPLLDYVNDRFSMCVEMGDKCTIDESVMGFKGRLVFKVRMPDKKQKDGIKLYKLCSLKAYTHKLMVYTGRGMLDDTGALHSHAIVIQLAEDYLDAGRTIFADNFYCGVPLAEELLQRKTYLCGTVRPRRKRLPLELMQKNLEKGEVAAMRNSKGVAIIRWKDKKVVNMLSSVPEHFTTDTVATGRLRRGVPVCKPPSVIEYNMAKKGVDVADQLLSYYYVPRKGLKWYRKLALYILTGVSVVNASIVFHQQTSETTLLRSTENIARSLIRNGLPAAVPDQGPYIRQHILLTRDGPISRNGRPCSSCYQLARNDGASRDEAKKRAKRVLTVCNGCEGQPSLCLPCYNYNH